MGVKIAAWVKRSVTQYLDLHFTQNIMLGSDAEINYSDYSENLKIFRASPPTDLSYLCYQKVFNLYKLTFQLAKSAKARSRYFPYRSGLLLIFSPKSGKIPKFGGIG